MKIWSESEVRIETLASHLEDAGVDVEPVEYDFITIHTDRGLGYRIHLDQERRFVTLWSSLPLDPTRSTEDKLGYVQYLNETVFLPSFCLREDALYLSYVMSYRSGLIAGQFVSIVNRFGSMLNHVVHSHNRDEIIKFEERDGAAETDSECVIATDAPKLVH